MGFRCKVGGPEIKQVPVAYSVDCLHCPVLIKMCVWGWGGGGGGVGEGGGGGGGGGGGVD